MDISQIPTRFPIPFANGALAPDIRPIPTPSQIPFQAGAASLTDGFPPVNFLPIGAGGTPFWGADVNGILNQISAWCRWKAAGAPVPYDNTFAVAIGGYPQGTILPSTIPGGFWISTVDNNQSDPNGGTPTNWSAYGPSTGDAKLTMKAAADYGWIVATDGTIGGVASNATYANANASALYALTWGGVSNTFAPILTNAGVPTTRGANAAADFAASKQLTLTKQLGRALIIAGAGAGLTARALGEILGEEAHSLTANENGPHTHAGIPRLNVTAPALAPGSIPYDLGGTSGSSGLGAAHNTMQPSTAWNIHIKL